MLRSLLIIILLFIYTPNFLPAQSTTASVVFTVDMSDIAVSTEGVFVVGNFFNQSPEPLIDNGDGTWSYFGIFSKGDSLTYLFRNGEIDEVLQIGNCTTSEGEKRLLVVPNEVETTLPEVCFNHCIICNEITTNTTDFLLEEKEFQLFPNPMQSTSNLCWKNEEDIIINRVKLLDIKGSLLREYKNLTSPEISIKRGNLGTGIYLLNIIDQKGRVFIQKLMVN